LPERGQSDVAPLVAVGLLLALTVLAIVTLTRVWAGG
jgi:hypothetical protein